MAAPETTNMMIQRAFLLLACFVAAIRFGAPPLAAASLTPLFAYPGTSDGRYPQANLIDVGGVLYGVAAGGGNWRNGTIFSLNPATETESTIYSFTGQNDGAGPNGGLIEVGGLLYGTTSSGGASGQGVLFSFNPVSGVETTLATFGGGTQASSPCAPLLNVNGVLYGTTCTSGNGNGTIFSFDIATGEQKTLYAYMPCCTISPLIAVGSLLYGTSGNTVFSFDPSTSTYRTVYQFTSNLDGCGANGALLYLRGLLYGTASRCGFSGEGVVYAIDPALGTETTLYAFTGGKDGGYPEAALIDIGGILYGTCSAGGEDYSGTIFEIDPKNHAERTIYAIRYPSEGAFPEGALLDVGGVLYATVGAGGTSIYGSIIAVDIATRKATLVHRFVDANYQVNSALTNLDGMLYGVSSQGGSSNNGIIVQVNPATRAATIAYAFAGGKDGAAPEGALATYGQNLYGTTASGGTKNFGTVFGFNPRTHVESPLYAFNGGADGAYPEAQLLPVKGLLTGTTPYGGNLNNGSVFQINPKSGAETTLFSFDSFDFKSGDLNDNWALISQGGYLYGMRSGNFYNVGIIYSVNIASGAGAVLHNFQGSPDDGRYPNDNLINVGGNFYGTTAQGGASLYGTVFKLDRRTGAETVIYSFAGGADGDAPSSALLSMNGLLYGTTRSGGAFGDGTLFAVNPSTGAKTTLYSFTGGADGAGPQAALILVGSVLYGTTNSGGPNNHGTAFSFTP